MRTATIRSLAGPMGQFLDKHEREEKCSTMDEALKALSLLPATGRRGQPSMSLRLLKEATMSRKVCRHCFVGSPISSFARIRLCSPFGKFHYIGLAC